MNPVATSHVSGSITDLHATRVTTNCTQHLQPTRQFGCTSLRLCSRQLHRARKQALETCLVAAVEAPAAASSSNSVEDELNPHDLYKRFDRLLSQYEYSYKQGDKVKGKVFRVDQRAAYVDIGAKASAVCPAEECSLVGVQRVCPSAWPCNSVSPNMFQNCGGSCAVLFWLLQATQVLKADDEREFIVVRDEYKGGDIRLSLRKVEVAMITLHSVQHSMILFWRALLLGATTSSLVGSELPKVLKFGQPMLQEAICWQRVKQLQEEDATVSGTVVQINKGGVMVEVQHLRGFVPMSQIQNVNVSS